MDFAHRVSGTMEKSRTAGGEFKYTDEERLIRSGLVITFVMIFTFITACFMIVASTLIPNMGIQAFSLFMSQSMLLAFFAGRYGAENLYVSIGRHLIK